MAWKSLIFLFCALSSCAAITPESVINGYQAKRVEIMNGSVTLNYWFALDLLPICYSGLNDGTLEATEIEENGVKTLLLGNFAKGGTGLFEFRSYPDGKTELTAYSNEWYKMDVRLFHRFVDGIVSKDMNVCD